VARDTFVEFDTLAAAVNKAGTPWRFGASKYTESPKGAIDHRQDQARSAGCNALAGGSRVRRAAYPAPFLQRASSASGTAPLVGLLRDYDRLVAVAVTSRHIRLAKSTLDSGSRARLLSPSRRFWTSKTAPRFLRMAQGNRFAWDSGAVTRRQTGVRPVRKRKGSENRAFRLTTTIEWIRSRGRRTEKKIEFHRLDGATPVSTL